MEDAQKKVSFGFSKSNKVTKLVKPVKVVKKIVDYVDSFDGKRGKFSYQGVVREEAKKEPLVIPLVGTRTAYDVIKAKLDNRSNREGDNTTTDITIKTETQENLDGPKAQSSENIQVKVEEDVKPSLESLAAKEILDGLNKNGESEGGHDSGRIIVPDVAKATFEGEKESTLEDYENVPVGDYGLALLRGMGWNPQTGIGKDSKIVAPVTSKVRPKRLGLGAEGSLLPPGDRPPLKRGVFVQITAGQHNKSVGVVEGTDGDTGSVVIKVAGVGNVSLSENAVNILTKKEYELINSNGTAAEKPVEKKYGINEFVTDTVHIKKETPKSSTDEVRRRERKVRSASRSPKHKRRSRSADKRGDKSSSKPSGRKQRRSKSNSTDRTDKEREKKFRSLNSNNKFENEKKGKYRSISDSPEGGRYDRRREYVLKSPDRRRRDGEVEGRKRSGSYDSTEKKKSRRDRSRSESSDSSSNYDVKTHKSRRKKSRNVESNDNIENQRLSKKDKESSKQTIRSRSSEKGKKKKRKARSSSSEKYPKKGHHKKSSDEEVTSRHHKKKKKKSKRSRRESHSES